MAGVSALTDVRYAAHRVEQVMGTVVSIGVCDGDVPARALDAALAWFHEVDARFSPFIPESEVSRLSRGELSETDVSRDLRHVLELCDALAVESGGAFDARRHRSDGGLDPSGVVKGWSVDEAAIILDAAGARRFAINAGGDIVVRGEPSPGRGWRIGIRHPHDPRAVAAVLEIKRGAVATSGGYERGSHIVDPRSGRAPSGLLAVTVIGPNLAYADAYATAAFVMGIDGLAWVAAHAGFGALGITEDGRVLWSEAIDALRVA
jgi:thiamine biosynthesis lipoprotein